jgi:Zn-dependent peptidase ImmA (M78 family)
MPKRRLPWIKRVEIERQAAEFLQQRHEPCTIPVPIELLIERMGVDICPLPSLRDRLGLDALTALDRRIIYVDEEYSNTPRMEFRFRFTLAHELAHMVLHESLFDQAMRNVKDAESWLDLILSLPPEEHDSAEWQANCFAGLVLVPSESLRASFDRCRKAAAKQMEDLAPKRISAASACPFLWQKAVTRLSREYEVSEQVIEIRLRDEGFKQEDILTK